MTEDVLRKLYDNAYTLTRNAVRPIDVGSICAHLGIQIRRGTESTESGSSKRAFLLQTARRPQIVLPESPPERQMSVPGKDF